MKKSRKLMSILLVVAMLFTLAAPAMAAGEGKITIDDAVVDQTYSVYRILDLESYNKETGAYAYKANRAWEDFLTGDGAAYVDIDTQGYVTWTAAESAAAEFAKRAQAYVETNKIEPAADPIKAASTTVVFANLDLGYYLVDTTLGALCSLDTTDKEVTMKEKNEVPEVTKEVEEDSKVGKENVNPWGATNDADINQVVNYKAVIKVKAGAEKYILHDTMSAGLDFIPTSVKVTVDGESVAAGNYEVKTGLADGCTFEVEFTKDYIAGLAAGLKNSDDGTAAAEKEIIVTYSATLNENAVVGAGGNTNKVYLQYNNSNTTEDITTTYTWDMDVLKYGDGDKTKVLAGAEFVLLNSQKDKVATIVNGKLTGWVDVPAADGKGNISWPDNTTLTTNDAGKIAIEGLDADTYHLREIKAPAGYNKLNQDTDVTVTRQVSTDGKTMTYTKVTSEINNQSGAELPSTGGIGTTIFYVVGGALVLGAAVLLVTRRRMAE